MNDNPLVNPLLIEDFANPLTAETSSYFNFDPNNIPTYDPQDEPETFLVLPFNTKGGARNPFGPGYGNQDPPREVTASELQQMWRDSGQLQDQFGTIDRWKSFLVETRPMLEDADWWNAEMTYRPGDRKWLAQQNEDIFWAPGEKEELLRQIDYDQGAARNYEYQQWLYRHENTLRLYGIQPTIYNSDGDKFQWTGSAYQKVTKVDDSFDFSSFAKAVLKSALISAVTAGIGSVVSSYAATSSVAGAINSGLNTFREAVGGAIAALGNAPAALSLGSQGATYLGLLGPDAVRGLTQFFDVVLTSNGLATAAGISSALGNGAWTGPAAQAYEDAINANPNLIVNLVNAYNDAYQQGNYVPIGEDEDGNAKSYTVTNADFLPPGYILNEYGNIVHEESGTIVRDGDLRADLDPANNIPGQAVFVNFSAYNAGGGGGSNLSSTAISRSDAAMEAWNEAKADAAAAGLTGSAYTNALLDAWLGAGYTREDFYTMQERDDYTGVYSDDIIETQYESSPNLVIYNGNVELLDENGVWENGGTFMDRSDPNNPRRYFVWRNTETGQEVIRYEDELEYYTGTAKEFEAWLDRIPNLTDEERQLADYLINTLGQSPAEVYNDILTSREEIDGEPNPDDPDNTAPAEVGNPCSIGSYEGVYAESPTSGAIVCDISGSLEDPNNTNDGSDSDSDNSDDGDTGGETPVEGAECTLEDGTTGTIQGGVCTAPDRETQIPSFSCPSGFEYPDGVCVPQDAVGGGNSNGDNNDEGGDTTLQPGDPGYCDMERPLGPNGEYTFETQTWDRYCGGNDDGGDNSGGGDDDGNEPLQPGDPGYCDMERPLGPNGEYTFETQAWDRYCGGNNDGDNSGGDNSGDDDDGDDTDTGGPQPGDACTLQNGQPGTVDENGTCVAVGVGGTCTLQNGQPGTIDANGNCVADGTGTGDGTGDGSGDGDGNGSGDGSGNGDGDGIGDGSGPGTGGGFLPLGGGGGKYTPSFGNLFPVDPGPGYKGKGVQQRPVRGFLDYIKQELSKR